MTTDGFGMAINAFGGQSFGAGNLKRVKKGHITATAIMFIWVLLTTCLLVFGAAPGFSLDIHEAEVIAAGALSANHQFFRNVLVYGADDSGSHAWYGKNSGGFCYHDYTHCGRDTLAMILGSTSLGLEGIWWAFTISSIVKALFFKFILIW